jgi:DNA-binding MarR family transcriptional regulator
MTETPQPGMNAYDFIRENMDSVPHLEALMLLWNSRPVRWTHEELASRLYVSPEKVTELLRDLIRLQLVSESQTPDPKYSYFPRSENQDELMNQVDAAHRGDLIRISTMIHSKTSSPVREFARAFRLKKERD